MVSRDLRLKYPSMLVISCISESVALIIPNVANVFSKLNPSMVHFAKNSNFRAIDFLRFFFAERRKSNQKSIKLKLGLIAVTILIYPIIVQYITQCASMCDVACEFACAVMKDAQKQLVLTSLVLRTVWWLTVTSSWLLY